MDGLPSPADQLRNYELRMKTYEVVLAQWEKQGKVGSPPPRPVPPHTPGFYTSTLLEER